MSTLRSPAYGDAGGALAPRRSRKRGLPSTTILRLRVAAHHAALDSELARGSDPAGRPELAMRAAQLQRPRHRRVLARTLRRVVDEAIGPRPPIRATAVVIARAQVLAAADDVLALADRLDGTQPAHVTGLAIAQRLITDALESPLYVPSQPDTLSRLARQAVAKIDEPARP